MEWLWWVLGLVVFFFVANIVFANASRGSSSGSSSDELGLDRYRREAADYAREVGKVVDVIVDLPIYSGQPPSGERLSRGAIAGAVDSLVADKIRTEWRTNTKMVHIVVSPRRITVFAKLSPTRGEAAARQFTRIGQDEWVVSTLRVSDMGAAIREADLEAAS